MRSASFRNAIAIGFALAAAMSAGAQINPDTQIRWPPCYGAATLYDIVTNTCVAGNAPGSSLELQHNGTDLPVQSLLNFLDTAPGMPSGYQPVTWGNDSGGGLGGWVPPIPSILNSFTMFPGPPISGQYALIYPSSCGFTANPGNSSMSGSCSGGAGSMNAQNISGLNPASGYLSYIFTLPAGISQANITAVYAAGVYSIASAGDQYLEVPSCTDGTTSVYFFGASVSQLPLTGTSVLFSSVPTVSSVSCKLDAEGSSYIYPGTGGYLAAGGGFALYVYYTGTPIATPPTQVSVWSPLQINNGNFTLALPYNVGYDWSNTNSYNVTIPAYLAPGNSIAPGSEIVLEVSNSNTSTTVTVNVNGTVRPVRLKDSVTLPAVGDIAGNVGGGIGPPAVLILDGQGFYWDLQNPQVSGGSSFTAGGDLSGSSTSQEVVGVHSVPLCTGFTPTNGQFLQYTTASSPNPCWGATTASSGFTAGGDLSGTSTSQQVVGIDNVPLCTGYTPTNGQVVEYTTGGSPNPCYTAASTGGGAAFTPNAIQYATNTTASRAATAADVGTDVFGTDSGTGAAYAVAVSPSPTVTSNTTIAFLPTHNSSATPTLALNGGTAYPLVGDNNLLLQAGDLNVQTYARVQWNAYLSDWVLLNPTITGRPVTTAESNGSGADTFGDSTMYFGGDTTGCPTTGYQAGGVPTGGTGAAEVTCNNEPSLIVAAYNGVGHAFPASLSNFATGAYSNSTSMDVMDLQVLPNTTPTDSGEPDYFLQMSEGDALVGGIGTQPGGYESQVLAASGWLGAPRRSQMWATDTACVQTSGTWAADNTFHTGVALTASTTGTLTCTTPYPVGTGVIAIWKVTSGGTGAATFKIDSVTTDTWSAGAAGTISTGPGNTAGWWGAAYSLNTTAASHVFTVQVTTAPFTFVLFSMPQPQQIWLGLNYPRVYIGGPENYNSTTIAYDPYTQTAVNAAIAAGFSNVKYVSLINAIPDEGGIAWTGGTYPNGRVCPVSIASGSAHPGNCGHLFESWAFLQAAGKTPSGRGVTSFNARTGAVVPQTADYDYTQVTNAAGLPAANLFTNTNTFKTPSATAQAQIIKGTNGSYATPAIVQQTTQDSPTTSFTFSGVVAGDTLMSNCRINGGSGVYTDSQSQTINTTGAYSNPTFNELDNANSGTHTWTTGSTPQYCWFAEISGLNGVNQTYSSSYTNMPVVPTNALTTTAPTYLIAGVIAHSATFGSSGCTITATGYTTIQNTDANINVFGLVESSTGTYSANLNGTGSGCSNGNTYEYIVAFNLGVTSGQTGDLVDYQSYSGSKIASIGPNGTFYPAGLGQNAASQMGGTCAMSSGTSCTLTIGHTYTTPVCIATQQSGTLTGAAVGCTVSGVTVTVTAATTNSETWGVLVFGNPN